jgi:hypothetical protein
VISHRRLRLGTLALFVFGFFFFGCGDPDGLPDQAAAQLRPQVEAIRTAAAAGDRAGAEAALAALRQAVAGLQASQAISVDQASDVLAAAGGVEAQLGLLPAPPPPPPPAPPPSPPAQTEEDKDEDREKGKGDKGGDGDD